MFLIDDILMAPFNGMLWIFEEIHKAAQQERENESESITAELQKLYMLLESASISEEEFDKREAELLDRLDSLREMDELAEEDEEFDEEESEDIDAGSTTRILDSESD